jgi:hypothetical protein
MLAGEMGRWIVALTAWLALAAGATRTAHAERDQIDRQVAELGGGSSYKVRLAAALALSRSGDARGVRALTNALDSDAEASIRRVAALGLGKLIDKATPTDALDGAIAALDHASKNDKDTKVRSTAAKALESLATVIEARRKPAKSTTTTAATPAVFVNVETANDITKRASATTGALTKVVRGAVKQKGYAVEWPGGPPTQKQLTDSGARAFIVGATVKVIDVTAKGNKMEVGCTVAIRIAPWTGSDGAEQWEANRAASASGSATAVTASGDRAIAGGIRDCVEAVAEEITARQVVPFIKRLAAP